VLAQAADEFTAPFAATMKVVQMGAPLLWSVLYFLWQRASLQKRLDGPVVSAEAASNREGLTDDLPLGHQPIVCATVGQIEETP
jgi:hypothetical protein